MNDSIPEGEIRLNKVTRQWVIIAPQRGRRPRQFTRERNAESMPPFDPHCPFCPGNEDHLTRIILETGATGSGWATRVVPNKFPALSPDGPVKRVREGIYFKLSSTGSHEVIIETPHHDRQPDAMTVVEVESVIETYHRRYRDLTQHGGNMQVLIFRNHGRRAGTSIIHPHSQIVATPMISLSVRRREEESRRYFDEWGLCLLCRILEFEIHHGSRVLYQNDAFVGFVPYAAEVPFEIWIVPKYHQGHFGSLDNRAKTQLAMALQTLLKRLADKLGNPDYNYVLNSATGHHTDDVPHLHWYIRIIPRLTTFAGFELGTGIRINPSSPESDAEFLQDGL